MFFDITENMQSHSTGIRNLDQKLYKEIEIPLPSLSKQKSIVAKLDGLSVQIKKLETIYKQKLADLEELKKSVLKKTFAGEL